MTKHTPGNKEVTLVVAKVPMPNEEETYWSLFNKDTGEKVAPWSDSDTPERVMVCLMNGGLPRAEEAAAPELLEALKDLLERADTLIFRPPVDDMRKIDQDTRNLRAGLEAARAAIAKATGTE